MSTIFLTCLVLLCAAVAVLMWRSGDQTAHVVAKYVPWFGLTMAVVVATGTYANFVPTRRPGPVVLGAADGKDATIIPGSVVYLVLYQLIWFCFAVLFLAAGVETAIAAWRTHWPLALLFACLGLCSASAPALALAGRLGRGRVVLTTEEIIHEGWGSRTRMPWADTPRVIAAFEQSPLILVAGSDGTRWSQRATTPQLPTGNRRRQIWMLDRPARTGSIVVECPRLAVDGHQLLRFLTYYADNPAARTELGTPRSLDRWQAALAHGEPNR
ncbi:hypothetical protein [Nocardia sp. NPDC019395]|uniref:hypothetical protein n=1 Tax=Nocardia sp. NPDC019395 TaxID=3154686 RepID=UPI00340DD68A